MKQKKTVASKKKEAAVKPISRQKKTVPELLPLLDNYFEQHGFLILSALLIIVCLFVFKDFIFLNKIYLYKDIGSDSINATYPHEYQVAYYMRNFSFIPKWSFYQGMGQNIFPFCIPDPYYFVLMLFGPKNIMYGIGYMEIAKVVSAGLLFYLFLRKIRLSGFVAILGALLFAFSGFVILGSCWTIFSTEAVYVALILLGFELLYRDNNIVVLPIGVCLLAINQPFDLALTTFFLVPYILFRYFNDHSFNVKKISILFFKVACLGALGVLMSSFFLFPDIIQMLESPRVGGESSYFAKLLAAPVFSIEGKLHNVTALTRFFSNDLMGTGSNFQGWYNYLEAPLFYVGLINFLFVPQLFLFLNKRKKFIYLGFLILFLIPVAFPFFRYTFWLFTGDYYRLFSFFVGLILLLYGLMGLNFSLQIARPSFLIAVISLIFLFIVLLHDYFPDQEIINQDVRTLALAFVVCYSILAVALRAKRFKNVLELIILLVSCVELISFSNITVNDRPVINGSEVRQKTGFNDYSIEAVNYLRAHDKAFFRITKDYSSGPAIHSSINDAQVQNFFGTPSYTSFNQINYIKFLQEMAIIDPQNEFQTRWSPGLVNSPFLHSFGSVRYALVKKHNSFLFGYNYDSLTSVGGVEILRNKYALPLGFTYDRFIVKKDFRNLSASQKTLTLYKAFVLDDSVYGNIGGFSKFPLVDTSKNYNWKEFADDIAALKQDTLNMTTFAQNDIKGRLKLDRQKLLFFSIPFDKGWTARIDNKRVNPMMTNIGFIGFVVGPGDHQIELSFNPRFFGLGAIISIVAVIFFVLLVITKSLWMRKVLIAN